MFGQYEPADQEVWFDLARTWATDPAQAAQVMQQIAEGVLGRERQQMSTTASNTAAPAGPRRRRPTEELTPAKVQELIEQGFQTREQSAAEQKAVDDVMSEVRDARLRPRLGRGVHGAVERQPSDRRRHRQGAAEMVKGYRQSDHRRLRSRTHLGPCCHADIRCGVQATARRQPITNFEDARRATDAFLRERRGA